MELYLKKDIIQFYKVLGTATLVLDTNTLINNAGQLALKRDVHTLYEPIVVENLKGYRGISLYSLLMAQQDKLRDLWQVCFSQ